MRKGTGLSLILGLAAASCDGTEPLDDAGLPGADGGIAAIDARGPSDATGAGDAAGAGDAVTTDGGSIDGGSIDGGSTDGGSDPLGTWLPIASLRRGPRQETAVVALRNEVVVIGGFNAAGQVMATVEAYDATLDQWRDLASLPLALHHANAAVVAGRIYVLGFLTGLNFAADGRGFVYDPDANRWDPVASMPAGTERGGSGTAALDGAIYVAGGLRGGSVADFSRYDPALDRWQPLPDLPEALDHLVAGSVGGEVHLIGGRAAGITSHNSRVRAYSPVSATFRDRAPMPTSRGGAAAAVHQDQIYVFGGEGNPAPGSSGVFAAVEVYDPTQDRWRSLTPMRTPRHGTGAAAIAGRIIVPGGADRQAFAAVDTCEAYLPSP
ncbi:MAG: kelch repeat-containing protein [Deltaproteobacteria bacterium]|nr:kelch repeat-containing protein [Deltaproteobacteria bacterium]